MNQIYQIDSEKRQIIIPKDGLILGVVSDEKAEAKTFKCNRYTGNGLDLYGFSIRINFANANNEADQYIANDVELIGEDEIQFSWILSRNVTAYKGTVKFIVCAVTTNEEGIITNEWNTTVSKGLVLEGIEVNGSQYEEQTADAIEGILLKVNQRVNDILKTLPADFTETESRLRAAERTIVATSEKLQETTESLKEATEAITESENARYPFTAYKTVKAEKGHGNAVYIPLNDSDLGKTFIFELITKRSITDIQFSLWTSTNTLPLVDNEGRKTYYGFSNAITHLQDCKIINGKYISKVSIDKTEPKSLYLCISAQVLNGEAFTISIYEYTDQAKDFFKVRKSYPIIYRRQLEAKELWSNKNQRFEGFALSTVYDEELERICIFYNAKESHTDTSVQNVYMRYCSIYDDNWSDPILVRSANYCIGACIDAYGQYLAMVSGGFIMLSTDHGETWTAKGFTIKDGSETLTDFNVSEVGSIYRCENNRLVARVGKVNGELYNGIIYNSGFSAGSYASWNIASIDKKDTDFYDQNAIESHYVEIDGVVYEIARTWANVDEEGKAIYTESKESAFSFTTNANYNSWKMHKLTGLDAHDNPVAIGIYNDYVYLFNCSRHIRNDGYGRMYITKVSKDEFVTGNLTGQRCVGRIGNGTDFMAHDFGYASMVIDKNGIAHCFFYADSTDDMCYYGAPLVTKTSDHSIYGFKIDLNE